MGFWELCQFYYLEVVEGAVVYGETHKRADLMEPVDARSAGIDVQRVECAVVHNL